MTESDPAKGVTAIPQTAFGDDGRPDLDSLAGVSQTALLDAG